MSEAMLLKKNAKMMRRSNMDNSRPSSCDSSNPSKVQEPLKSQSGKQDAVMANEEKGSGKILNFDKIQETKKEVKPVPPKQ